MIHRANDIFSGDISDWDVTNVTNMSEMFYGSKFSGDISKWNVSKVISTSCMFDRSPLQYKKEYKPVFQPTVNW